MKNSLIINNLSFCYRFDYQKIIDGFSCEIFAGSRVAILGLNGSGKTTLLSLVLGSLKPDTGEISLFNNATSTPVDQLNGKVGFLPQLENIPFNYSLNDYVLLGRAPYISIYKTPSEEDEKIVLSSLKLLNIINLKDRTLGEISGGELQRARLARIIAQNPEIILMDEPISHLDIKNRVLLYDLMNQMKCDGKIILYTSHDPAETAQNSEYMILLNKSLRTLFGKTKMFLNNSKLSEYFETPISL